MQKQSLIFVYNADSGLFNTATDIAHKILSPDTYSCDLCALTHGYFSIRDQWVTFLEKLNASCEFLHRDEFEKKYGKNTATLPAVFIDKDNHLCLFINQAEIANCTSLDELQTLIETTLETVN